MTRDEYDRVYDIGYDSAEAKLAEGDDANRDLDHLDDIVFPDAFAEALGALEHIEAEHISAAVHDGIRDAWLTSDHDPED